jgi:hypothetical protein
MREQSNYCKHVHLKYIIGDTESWFSKFSILYTLYNCISVDYTATIILSCW